MKGHGRISFLALRLGLPLVLGLVASAILLGLMLAGSDGTEPRGVCEFVSGDAGLLPLNPNEGGTYSYSCDPNLSLAVFYILVAGMALSVLFWILAGLFLPRWRPAAKQRNLGSDTGFPAADRDQPE